MDSQDYLDQISASAKPVRPKKSGVMAVLTSKYFKWGVIFVSLIIVMAIFGAILSRKESIQDKCVDLKLRLDQTSKVVTEYQRYIKSSDLRSYSASLNGILTNTSAQLGNFMAAEYNYEEGRVDDAIIEEAELNADALKEELFNAKINGVLDRTYAHKMALEIYSVMSEEMGIYNSTEKGEIRALLESSHDSLNNLYTNFNDFSETN